MKEEEEPPLLEDMGIDPSLAWDKIKCIIVVDRPYQVYVDEPDLAGPIFIAFVFGLELLLSGKVNFGDLYATFITGNFLAYLLFNLMTQKEHISLYSIMSILGYGMTPLLLLGLVGMFASLKGQLGLAYGMGVSVWCGLSAANYLELMIGGHGRKALIVFPLCLFYASFVMVTIF